MFSTVDIPAAKAFHALSDPLRLRIIESLRDNEYCVADLCDHLNVSQSKLSFHLRVLKEAAIVRSRPQGRWTYYSLNLPQNRCPGAAFGGLSLPHLCGGRRRRILKFSR
jgi:ArsR family transcriptional regulator